jgi:branched-chain amino acid transport system permease protein
LWSIGHLGFFGSGMLLTGLLLANAGWTPLPAIGASTLTVAGLAFLMSVASLRLKQDFFLILSVGFAYVVYAANVTTTGVNGLSNIPSVARPLSDAADLWLAGTMLTPCCALLLFAQMRLRKAGFTPLFACLRQDDQLAQLFGISPLFYRALVFVTGSVVAGYAGAVFTIYSRGTSPERCNLSNAISLSATAVLGGAGRLRGDVVGALVFVMLPRILEWVFVDWLHASLYAAQWAQLIFGLVLTAGLIRASRGMATNLT